MITRYSLHHLLDPLSTIREMARVCVPDGRIVVVDTYAPEDPAQTYAYNRVERLRDPSHARALSLTELKGLFGRVGLPEPQIMLYELPVEVKDLLARAFPNSGDHAKIIDKFREAASSGRRSGFLCGLMATASMSPTARQSSFRSEHRRS